MTPVIFLVAALLVAGCGSTASGHPVTVQALWWGEDQEGRVTGGLTPVQIGTEDTDGSAIDIDIAGFEGAGTGEVWNAVAASAATVAPLVIGLDPCGVRVSFKTSEAIDGPSAGALLTAGVASSFTSALPRSDRTMTGTILPNGAVGPVGGIPVKVRAAAEAGMKTILIPKGQRRARDPSTGSFVDVGELGEGLGVDVREVTSVQEALHLLTGGDWNLPDAGEEIPINSTVEKLLTRASRDARFRLDAALRTLPPSDRHLIQTGFDSATRGVARTDDEVIAEFARVSSQLRQVVEVVAKRRTTGDVSRVGIGRARAQLAEWVDAALVRTRKQLEELLSWQPTKVEQVVGMADVASWAVDALALLTVVDQQLNADRSLESADLARLGVTAARARYDATVMMPIAKSVLKASGKVPMNDRKALLDRIACYADFMMIAARSTFADFEAQRAAYKRTGRRLDEKIVRIIIEQPSGALIGSDTSSPIVQLAVGMSAWVATTQLSSNVEYTSNKSGGEDIEDLLLSDPENFRRQSDYSSRNSATLATNIVDLGGDPSYVQWGNRWGKDLAVDGATGSYSDAARVEGLAYQWYANIQGDMLAAVLRDPPMD